MPFLGTKGSPPQKKILRSVIKSESIFFFFIKYYISTVLNFCLELFVPRNCVKKWISHCIFKKWFGWGDIFRDKKILKEPNTNEYCQVLVVLCPKLNSIAAILCPPLMKTNKAVYVTCNQKFAIKDGLKKIIRRSTLSSGGIILTK